MVPALSVANMFLVKMPEKMNAMKLSKLVYFAHGWHLALYGEPLIAESILGMPYGVAVASVRYVYSPLYGKGAIDSIMWHNEMGAIDCIDKKMEKLIDRIIKVYGGFKDFQLSQNSHKVGSPWHRLHDGGDHVIVIPDKDIMDYFRGMAYPT